MKKLTKNWLYVFILTLYAFYAGVFIYRSSFIIEDTRYFVLFDDAMISMRYARNLAEGHGLVWNPGETPVEGYTNPLWTIFMAFFHLFPIPTSKISLAIQISGAVFLGINLIFVKKIIETFSNILILPTVAMLLTAFYTPLNNWGLMGMEVSILTLLLSAAVWKMLVDYKNETFSPWPYLLMALGTFVRIDMVVSFLVMLGFGIIFIGRYRWQHLAWGLGLLIVSLSSQTLFRILYYGDPLPNTFYLKVGGLPFFVQIKHGLKMLFRFIWDMNWVLFVLPFTYLLFRRDRKAILLGLLFLGQIAYSVYVGGDAWEHKGGANRYISIAMPAFFTLFILAADQILGRTKQKSWFSKPILANLALITFSLAAIVNFNFIQRSTDYLKRWLLLEQPLFVEGNKEITRIGLAVSKITTPEASVAVVTAGSIPYFANRPAIDLLGKNDAYIARLPSHTSSSLEDIRPGHMKWDYDYSIGQLKPDMIVQLWGDKEVAYDYIDKYYTVVEVDGMLFSARSDSPNILWERVDTIP